MIRSVSSQKNKNVEKKGRREDLVEWRLLRDVILLESSLPSLPPPPTPSLLPLPLPFHLLTPRKRKGKENHKIIHLFFPKTAIKFRRRSYGIPLPCALWKGLAVYPSCNTLTFKRVHKKVFGIVRTCLGLCLFLCVFTCLCLCVCLFIYASVYVCVFVLCVCVFLCILSYHFCAQNILLWVKLIQHVQ